jgi:hypothetical protein
MTESGDEILPLPNSTQFFFDKVWTNSSLVILDLPDNMDFTLGQLRL